MLYEQWHLRIVPSELTNDLEIDQQEMRDGLDNLTMDTLSAAIASSQ